jgi:hypothetical protein
LGLALGANAAHGFQALAKQPEIEVCERGFLIDCMFLPWTQLHLSRRDSRFSFRLMWWKCEFDVLEAAQIAYLVPHSKLE